MIHVGDIMSTLDSIISTSEGYHDSCGDIMNTL